MDFISDLQSVVKVCCAGKRKRLNFVRMVRITGPLRGDRYTALAAVSDGAADGVVGQMLWDNGTRPGNDQFTVVLHLDFERRSGDNRTLQDFGINGKRALEHGL